MLLYLLIGAPNSTSNFLIAKIWIAPETSGGAYSEDRKGLTVIFFFLFNIFFGFLNFYNDSRKKRANCVMGLSIFYLIYLIFKVIAISFPLFCGTKINKLKDNKIKDVLSGEKNEHLYESNNNQLAKSTEKLNKGNNENENEKENDNENEEEEKKDNENEDEHNEEEEEGNDEDNVNQ